MEIKWHGDTCFAFNDKAVKIATDPHKNAGKLKADIVLTSLEEKNRGEVEDVERVFDWPGEYEMKDVPIIGFRAWTKSLSKEEEEKQKGEETIIFYFEIDGIKICHLGEVGHVLTSDMVKQLGDIDILLIKTGEVSNLDKKKALEIVEEIDPRVVIPMGLVDHNSLLKEIGVDEIEEMDIFTIKQASELPDDKRIYVALKQQ